MTGIDFQDLEGNFHLRKLIYENSESTIPEGLFFLWFLFDFQGGAIYYGSDAQKLLPAVSFERQQYASNNKKMVEKNMVSLQNEDL